MATQKPTFKELLERHGISFETFYETCLTVPTIDIGVLYEHDAAIQYNLEKMLAHLNTLAGQSYTIEDISIKTLYGDYSSTMQI